MVTCHRLSHAGHWAVPTASSRLHHRQGLRTVRYTRVNVIAMGDASGISLSGQLCTGDVLGPGSMIDKR